MHHYEEEINLMIDGELPEDKKADFFRHLAECKDCSNLYADYLVISNTCREITSSEIESLKSGINKKSNFYRYAFYYSTAASIIFFILFLFSISNVGASKENDNKVDTIFLERNELIKNVNEDGIPDGSTNPKFNSNYSSDKAYLKYIKNLRTITFNNSTEDNI